MMSQRLSQPSLKTFKVRGKNVTKCNITLFERYIEVSNKAQYQRKRKNRGEQHVYV